MGLHRLRKHLLRTVHRSGFRFVLFVLLSAVALIFGYLLSPYFRVTLDSIPEVPSSAVLKLVLYSFSFAIVASAMRVHVQQVEDTNFWYLLQVGTAATMAFGIFAGLNYLFFYRAVGRYIGIWSVLLTLLLMMMVKFIIKLMLRNTKLEVMCFGPAEATSCFRDLIKSRDSNYQIAGCFDSLDELRANERLLARVDLIVPCFAVLSADQQSFLIDASLERRISIQSPQAFADRVYHIVPRQFALSSWDIVASGNSADAEFHWVKRILDVAVALGVLILTTPVLVIAGLLTYLADRHNILYRQVRVGLGGKPFTMWKLRTMRPHAESGGAVWAKQADPRVTLFGRIWRKTRIDELPQLYNVLKGEMSMVGPRPERPEIVAMLSQQIPQYNLRQSVKPGITGWAQVSYRYGNSVEDARTKLEYDLYYIRRCSVALDLKIMAYTVWSLTTGAL